jgi:hypothetical protein
MEFHHVDRAEICRSRTALLTLTRSLASTATPAQAHGLGWGLGAGLVGAAIVGGAIAASNPTPITTVITAAAGFASSKPTATTSAAFAPATDRLS